MALRLDDKKALVAEVADGGIRYRFIADGARNTPQPWDRPARTVQAVADARPDVVHVNGLIFPGCVRALRAALPSDTAIVLQDHSGAVPRSWPWPLAPLAAGRWQRAFADADACTFTARALAERWHRFGLPTEVPVLEIPEASTSIGRQPGCLGVEKKLNLPPDRGVRARRSRFKTSRA